MECTSQYLQCMFAALDIRYEAVKPNAISPILIGLRYRNVDRQYLSKHYTSRERGKYIVTNNHYCPS